MQSNLKQLKKTQLLTPNIRKNHFVFHKQTQQPQTIPPFICIYGKSPRSIHYKPNIRQTMLPSSKKKVSFNGINSSTLTSLTQPTVCIGYNHIRLTTINRKQKKNLLKKYILHHILCLGELLTLLRPNKNRRQQEYKRPFQEKAKTSSGKFLSEIKEHITTQFKQMEDKGWCSSL